MTKTLQQGSRSYLLLIAGVGALGGLLFGYDTAVTSGAIGFLQAHFALSAGLTGWAASSVLIGCMAGAVAGGPLSDRIGRKKVLIASAVLFAISGLLTAYAIVLNEYVAGRFLGGIAIGAVSVVSPLYIAEVSPGRVRGQLVTLYQLAIVSGILIVFFVNLLVQRHGSESWNETVGWRIMFGSLTVPAVLLFVLSLFIPESPRWLMMKGRTKAARVTLERVGGDEAAEQGIKEIEESLAEERGTLAELFTPAFRRPLLTGVLLAILCQFSGINAIMYYATVIFDPTGKSPAGSFRETVLVGVVNLLFTFVAIWLIDRVGRRSLLIAGSAVQVVALAAVGAAYHFHLAPIFLLLPILLFIAAFASAMGPIPWVIISEIFPTKIRGSAMATATLVLWAADFVVAYTFPILKTSIGLTFTFWIYAFFSLLGLIMAWKLVVETKGRTLEQIEAGWRPQQIAAGVVEL